MEFRKREVIRPKGRKRRKPYAEQEKEFRARKVAEPDYSNRIGGVGPNLGMLKGKIEEEYAKVGLDANLPEVPNTSPTQNKFKVLRINFKCEMFEISQFNEVEMTSPGSSVSQDYDMDSGSRTYEYMIEGDSTTVAQTIKQIVNYWKPFITNRKYTFSIKSKLGTK